MIEKNMLPKGSYVNNAKERADYYFHLDARNADFLDWLFDTELWYTTQKEMWDKFEKFEQESESL